MSALSYLASVIINKYVTVKLWNNLQCFKDSYKFALMRLFAIITNIGVLH